MQNKTERETVDFYASSKRYAEKKMEVYIQSHLRKYKEMLRVENLREIEKNVRRCNLTHDYFLSSIQ